jgi:RNA polymerase sigma-70 factor (ECF subfamily)
LERFEALFRAEYRAVADYIGRRAEPDVVDDLVNEVFLVAWRRLERVPAEPRAWLLAVARNAIGTHIRGARRCRALAVRLAVAEVDWTQPPPKVDGGEVAAALAGLPEKDREALMLVSWDGLSPSEAAVVLGERPASFRVRLHRARRRLARAIERPVQAPAPKTRLDELNIRKEVPNV